MKHPILILSHKCQTELQLGIFGNLYWFQRSGFDLQLVLHFEKKTHKHPGLCGNFSFNKVNVSFFQVVSEYSHTMALSFICKCQDSYFDQDPLACLTLSLTLLVSTLILTRGHFAGSIFWHWGSPSGFPGSLSDLKRVLQRKACS